MTRLVVVHSKRSGRWCWFHRHHPCSAAVLLSLTLLLLLLPSSSAQTATGIASGCPGGKAAVSAEVLDTSGGRPVVAGRLADVGMELSIGGIVLNSTTASTTNTTSQALITEVPVGTDLAVALGGNQLNFLEFLVRVNDTTNDDTAQLVLRPQANAQVADDCDAVGVAGLTNIDLEEKTLSTGTLRSEEEGLAEVDVTVIFLNSPVGSAYLYDSYQIRFVPAPDTGDVPSVDGGLVSSVASPTQPDSTAVANDIAPDTGDVPSVDGGLASSVASPTQPDSTAVANDIALPDGLNSVFDDLQSLINPVTTTATGSSSSGGSDNNDVGGTSPPPAFDGPDTDLIYSMINPLQQSAQQSAATAANNNSGGSSSASSPGGADNGGDDDLARDAGNANRSWNMRRGMNMMKMHNKKKMGMKKGKRKKHHGKMGGKGHVAAKFLHQLDDQTRPTKGFFRQHPSSDSVPRQQQRYGRLFHAPHPKRQKAPKQRI